MISRQIKKAKAARAVFIVFQILGIILIPLSIILMVVPSYSYLNTIINYAMNNPSNMETIFMNATISYFKSVTEIAILENVGIAMTIVFSILRAKKGNQIRRLREQLLTETNVVENQ